MTTDHCRHCGLDILLVSEGDTQEQYACDDWQHRSNSGAEWSNGHCPACAEAERIAAEADRRAEAVWSKRSTYYDDRDVRAMAYEGLAEFARGDT